MPEESIDKNLKIRFESFKNYIIENNFKFGDYWENAKKTFDVDYDDGNYYSKGIRNYLPFLYDFHNYDKNKIVKISGYDFLKVGQKKLCTTSNAGNTALIHNFNYYNLIQNYFKDELITCDVGSGSGLLQFIFHEFKKNKCIFIDIPEVLINSIALCFTLFPNKKIILPNEIKDGNLNMENYDFIFLFPSQKSLIQKKSVDFCFNTQSFMEMDRNEIKDYLQFFNFILKEKGFLFISNNILKKNYFFSYKFTANTYRKIFLKKDDFFHKNKSSTLLNLLLEKNRNYNFYFNRFDYFFGVFNLKNNEIIYWLKYLLISLIKKIFIFFYK